MMLLGFDRVPKPTAGGDAGVGDARNTGRIPPLPSLASPPSLRFWDPLFDRPLRVSLRLWHIAGVRAALLLALLAMGACAGAALERRAAAVDRLVAQARDSGAQRCAPTELAMAESHVDFAKQELSEGDARRAREELRLAEVNAQEAVRKSPKDLCVPKPPPPPEDGDGDGITDDIDQCPRIAEDLDGFEDEDGCPDLDNDGDGITDQSDECPLEPEDKDEIEDADGCPETDADGDGIADEKDACPLEAEDKDGFEDADGCPDVDNDRDGLADVDDKCPLEAEDKDGFEDEDGCPDCDNDGDGVPECPEVVDMCPSKAANTPDGCPEYKNVVVTEKKIEIGQTVYFETNKAVIKPVSFPLLDEVAQVLIDNPEIHVRVEGHTDARGGDDFNMGLSEARASAVENYLVARGVAAERMESQGLGETKPIADNRTRSGRAQNRRVEFVITKR